jgi:glucuronate isomerase
MNTSVVFYVTFFGTEIEAGELPNDLAWTGKVIQDICYQNAANYFGWAEVTEPSLTSSRV